MGDYYNGLFWGQVQLSLSDVRKVTGLAAANTYASFSFPLPSYCSPRVVALHVRMRTTAVRDACAVSVSGWGGILWERLGPMQCGRGFRLVVKWWWL